MQYLHSLGVFVKSNRLNVVGCTFSKIGETQEMMGCLFETKSTTFSLINLDINNLFDTKDEEESIGIMQRMYSILCQKYYSKNSTLKDCPSFPFPIAFTGNWNYKIPLKTHFQDQIKDMNVIAKMMYVSLSI